MPGSRVGFWIALLSRGKKDEKNKDMHRLIGTVLRPFWRVTRGLTLGVQGVVLDREDRILLVRHGYRPGWHLPGGGVEWKENTVEALERELREETGLELTATPLLHGIFTNFTKFPGDHIVVYIVRDWKQNGLPPANLEIREQRLVPFEELPEDLVTGARNRINEVFIGGPVVKTWV